MLNIWIVASWEFQRYGNRDKLMIVIVYRSGTLDYYPDITGHISANDFITYKL